MDPYDRYGAVFGGMVDRYLLPWMEGLSSTDHNQWEKVRDASFAWATLVEQNAELKKERNRNRVRGIYTKEERQQTGVQRAINRALKDEAKRWQKKETDTARKRKTKRERCRR